MLARNLSQLLPQGDAAALLGQVLFRFHEQTLHTHHGAESWPCLIASSLFLTTSSHVLNWSLRSQSWPEVSLHISCHFTPLFLNKAHASSNLIFLLHNNHSLRWIGIETIWWSRFNHFIPPWSKTIQGSSCRSIISKPYLVLFVTVHLQSPYQGHDPNGIDGHSQRVPLSNTY